MPEQATLSNECVVDRRRRDRRDIRTKTATRSSKRASVKAVSTPKPATEPIVEDESLLNEDDSTERRQIERRRQIDPTTCERDYQHEEVEFMTAMDDYKRRSGRPFPTWSEVLEVLRDLGYRKVAEPTQTYSGEE